MLRLWLGRRKTYIQGEEEPVSSRPAAFRSAIDQPVAALQKPARADALRAAIARLEQNLVVAGSGKAEQQVVALRRAVKFAVAALDQRVDHRFSAYSEVVQDGVLACWGELVYGSVLAAGAGTGGLNAIEIPIAPLQD